MYRYLNYLIIKFSFRLQFKRGFKFISKFQKNVF